jgi:hypothetical protein
MPGALRSRYDVLLSLFFIGMLGCQGPQQENGTTAGNIPKPALLKPTTGVFGRDAALQIAKDFFAKEYSSVFSLYEISIEDDPKIGLWVVYFRGGAPPLIVVLVDKNTGKASLHGT